MDESLLVGLRWDEMVLSIDKWLVLEDESMAGGN